MPQLSDRARLIALLSRSLTLLDSAAAVDSSEEEEADELAEMLEVVNSNRYLSRQRPEGEQRNRCTSERCEQYLSWHDDDFRRSFRVTHAQFDRIVELVEPDEVFKRKGKRGRRAPSVRYQVLAVLWRLGHSGTGATIFQTAERFGISGERLV